MMAGFARRRGFAESCIAASALFSLSCSPGPSGGRLVEARGVTERFDWSGAEQAQEVAVRTLRQTEAASFHVIRLRGAEKPHVHDRSDLSVFVLSGAVKMHIAGAAYPVSAGDVIDIPRGTQHWAENVAEGASVAYAIFTPPFDGKDRRPAPDPR